MVAVTAVVQNVVIERAVTTTPAQPPSATSSAPPWPHRQRRDRRGRWHRHARLQPRHPRSRNSVRNGKTVTVRTVAVSQALTTQTTAGVRVTHAGYMTLSATRSPSRRSRTATSPARRTRPSPRRSTWCAPACSSPTPRRDGPRMDAAPDLGALDPNGGGTPPRPRSSSPPRRGSAWSTPRRSPSRSPSPAT